MLFRHDKNEMFRPQTHPFPSESLNGPPQNGPVASSAILSIAPVETCFARELHGQNMQIMDVVHTVRFENSIFHRCEIDMGRCAFEQHVRGH